MGCHTPARTGSKYLVPASSGAASPDHSQSVIRAIANKEVSISSETVQQHSTKTVFVNNLHNKGQDWITLDSLIDEVN